MSQKDVTKLDNAGTDYKDYKSPSKKMVQSLKTKKSESEQKNQTDHTGFALICSWNKP